MCVCLYIHVIHTHIQIHVIHIRTCTHVYTYTYIHVVHIYYIVLLCILEICVSGSVLDAQFYSVSFGSAILRPASRC